MLECNFIGENVLFNSVHTNGFRMIFKNKCRKAILSYILLLKIPSMCPNNLDFLNGNKKILHPNTKKETLWCQLDSVNSDV